MAGFNMELSNNRSMTLSMAGGTMTLAAARDGSNVLPTETAMAAAVTAGGAFGSALEIVVAALVEAGISSDPSVIAAAVALANSGAGLVNKTDSGAPTTTAVDVPIYVSTPAGSRKLDHAFYSQDGTFMGGQYGGAWDFSRINVAGTEFLDDTNQLGLAGPTIGDGVTNYPTGASIDKTTGRRPLVILQEEYNRLNGVSGGSAIDIWPTAGQSNATPRTTTAASVITDWPQVLQYSASTPVWAVQTGVPSWLGEAFARKWYQEQAGPAGRRVGNPKCAVGSTGFSTADGTPGTWDRTKGANTLAHQLVSTTQAALAAAPTGSVIRGILWSQGEQDRGIVGTYQALLDDLITWVRTQLGLPNLPWILGSLVPEYARFGLSGGPDSRVDQINAILEDTPRRLDNVSFVPGPANLAEPASGGIHGTAAWQAARGRTMATTGWLNAVLNVTDATNVVPPQNLAVARSGGTATITWEQPPCKVTTFTLETCTDGTGTTWTAETLPSTLTHTFTKSVAAGTPLWARITTVQGAASSLASAEVHA